MKDLKLIIKRFIYRACVALLRLYWGAVGRKASVFGQSISLLPKTVFPSFWNLRLPTGDVASQIVRYADYVQMHSMVRYVSQLKHPAVIIDVGAHHGAYAIVLGKILQNMGVGGKIIAVEPNPLSFAVLEKNVSLNGLEGTVFCERVAVSDQASKMFNNFCPNMACGVLICILKSAEHLMTQPISARLCLSFNYNSSDVTQPPTYSSP